MICGLCRVKGRFAKEYVDVAVRVNGVLCLYICIVVYLCDISQ